MTGLVRILRLSAVAAWLGLAPAVAFAWTEDYQDVTGMKAIYDPQTGHLRFEGLFNINGIGIGRTENVQFRPEGAATTQASFAVANEEEVGWLFCDGVSGGSFDAGAIFPAGLSDGLSDFYIGVTTIGSGKRITPIPIYTSTASYLPSFDLYAGYYESLQPPVVEPPVVEPPVELPPVQLPPDLGPVVVDPVYPPIPVEPVLPPVVELPPPAVDPPVNNGPDWSVDLPPAVPAVTELEPAVPAVTELEPAVPAVTELEPADPGIVTQAYIDEIQHDGVVSISPAEPMVPPTVEGVLSGDQSGDGLTLNDVTLALNGVVGDDGLSHFPTGGLTRYRNWLQFDGSLEPWFATNLKPSIVNLSAVVDLSMQSTSIRSLVQFHVANASDTLQVHTMGFAAPSGASSVQSTIPEPASGAAMLSALAGWGACRRRLRRAA